MDILLEDAATIATFVAPGYVALTTYAAIYAKRDKDFSRLLIESVAVSLPIVALANWLWRLTGETPPEAVSALYVLLLLALSIVLGVVVAMLRVRWPLRMLGGKIGLGVPDEDFMRVQFAKLPRNASVTVTLKNGQIFSGTPRQGNVHTLGAKRKYYFSNVAWYDEVTEQWDQRPGGVIIDLENAEYIETPS